jgi:Glycosyl transferase family 11
VIVIVDKVGQLGNRLFHFAHFIAFAQSYGVRVANPAFEDFAPCFVAFRENLLCRFPTVRSRIRATEQTRSLAFRSFDRLARSSRHPVRVIRLAPGQSCDLRSAEFRRQAERRRMLLVAGWLFRDDASFREHADLLRIVFTPIERHRSRVEHVMSGARRECDVLIGVHVRHGDYRTYAGGRHFHPLDAYVTVMERVTALFPHRKVRFLVCSDQVENRTALANIRVTPGPGHLVEDMYALAECDYIIGPPSTYSAWASFYGGVPLYHFEDPGAALSLADFSVRSG